MSATVTAHGRDQFTVRLNAEEAIYVRDVLAAEWQRAKDHGAREIADKLTRALAR